MNRFRLAALVALLLGGSLSAAEKPLEVTVAAGKHDRVNVPVCVELSLRAELTKMYPTLKDGSGKPILAQLTGAGLIPSEKEIKDPKGVACELHFILPALKAGETAQFPLTFGPLPPKAPVGFAWKETDGNFSDLSFGDRPVLRFVHYPFDDSTKEKRERTFKVFHHLYDASGKHLLTNDGPGSQFPHHRGIFFGFNKVTYGAGKKADIWHCTGDTHMTFEKTLASEAGAVLGRHRVEIAWHGEKKEVFAIEERELTVYNIQGVQLVELASRVRTTGGPIKLDGDPQHAGFHFRAHKEVSEKTKGQTIFVRPDGAGEPGKTRNWPGDKAHVNLPWNAMSFVLGEQRYTAAYLDKPTNPKEARLSEREYGRIGSYFEYEVTEKKPLVVNYRLWVQSGQMKPAEVAEKSTAFVDPPTVTVK